jgi:hypothetical protein
MDEERSKYANGHVPEWACLAMAIVGLALAGIVRFSEPHDAPKLLISLIGYELLLAAIAGLSVLWALCEILMGSHRRGAWPPLLRRLALTAGCIGASAMASHWYDHF